MDKSREEELRSITIAGDNEEGYPAQNENAKKNEEEIIKTDEKTFYNYTHHSHQDKLNEQELELKKQELEVSKDLHKLRKDYAFKIFGLISAWLVFVV